ncbi:MAG: phosphoglycerate kinase [Candidatus Omnitrophota bacterium]|jgi:3-phosphoglycerate kinase
MKKLTIEDVQLQDKQVLARVDFNVPEDEQQNITDDSRIRASLPTIKYILEKGAKKIILMSHLGRPKGKVDEKYRLNSVAKRLAKLLGEPVKKLDDCIGEGIKKAIQAAAERVILLENLRFHPREEENDPGFAKELASLGDIFVNDAFGTAHRAHASTQGVTCFLTSVAGFLLEKEIRYLGESLENPKHPFLVILGGAKVSDKIGVIEHLLPKCDCLLIGGGMAYTFLLASGKRIGNSKLEKDKLDLARDILKKANQAGKEIILPIDNLVVDKIEPGAKWDIVGDEIPDGKIAVDIGPKTVKLLEEKLIQAKTVVWNGPLGIFEMDVFANGTKQIAEFLADRKDSTTTIIGGGDTAAAIAKFGFEDMMAHISTGGGASLEFMEGKELPGIAALTDK